MRSVHGRPAVPAPRRWVLLGGALLTLAVLAMDVSASAQPAAGGVRTEIEIRLVPQPNGAPSFGVPLQVGGQQVIAGLDSGSGGLRLLPAAQHGLRPTDDPAARTYSYGSGISITGPAAFSDVAFGAVRGVIKVQAVQKVSCFPAGAPCAVGERPIGRYGFFGAKQPDRGFKAMLGAIPNPQGGIVNPWVELGVRRWIISLPRPVRAVPAA